MLTNSLPPVCRVPFVDFVLQAQEINYNYMLCVGPKDMEAGTTGLRRRGQTVDTRGHKVDEVLAQLLEEAASKALPSDYGQEAETNNGGAEKKQGGKPKKGKAVKAVLNQPEFTKMEVRVGQITKVRSVLVPPRRPRVRLSGLVWFLGCVGMRACVRRHSCCLLAMKKMITNA